MIINTMLGGFRKCELKGRSIVFGDETFYIETMKEIDLLMVKIMYYISLFVGALLSYTLIKTVWHEIFFNNNGAIDISVNVIVYGICIGAYVITIWILRKIKNYNKCYHVGPGTCIYLENDDNPDIYNQLRAIEENAKV